MLVESDIYDTLVLHTTSVNICKSTLLISNSDDNCN